LTDELLTSFVMVDAKVRVNPARAASILGLRIATKPVTPTTALERRLKRANNHWLTKIETHVIYERTIR
jgi:hypothetical protein